MDTPMACSGVRPKKLKTASKPASRVPIPKKDMGISVISEVIVMISTT